MTRKKRYVRTEDLILVTTGKTIKAANWPAGGEWEVNGQS